MRLDGSRNDVRSPRPGRGPTVYQPVFDLRDGSVVGYEALVRGETGSDLESPDPALRSRPPARPIWSQSSTPRREAAVRGFNLNGSGPFALFLNAEAKRSATPPSQIRDPPDRGDRDHRAGADRQPRLAAAHDPLPAPRGGASRSTSRRRLALAGADAAALSRRHQARPAPRLRARPGRRRADRGRGRGRGEAPPGARARRGHRLRGATGGRARAFGAQLGQGFLLGEPAPLCRRLPEPGRSCG